MEALLGGASALMGGGGATFPHGLMLGIVGSLSMMITSWEKSDREKDQYLEKNREYGDTYDFIVVGGGTAGSLVANRLSKSYKVLLLEAGGEPHPFHGIPIMASFMPGHKQLDWMHETVPQKNALFGAEGNIGHIFAGRGLGGTSNLDYMMHLRGHPRDYDEWAKITGDGSWSYDALRPYFVRHENYLGEWMTKGEKGMHGSEGEMRLGPGPFSILGKRFVVAGNEMGLPHVDLNGHYEQGFDMMTQPLKMGHRQTAYDAFLRRGRDKWNLATHKYSTVHKVLLRGSNHEAYAVEFEQHGKLRVVYARKEIILSAGAINTPKLLMLSGIGDSNHLQNIGIPAKVHLPGVGSNLQDHLGVPLGPFFTQTGNSIRLERDVGPAAVLAMGRGDGVLTLTGFEAAAMLTSDQAKTKSGGDAAWPDVELILNTLSTEEMVASKKKMRRDVMNKYYKNSKGKDSFTIIVSATRPKSKGGIRLRDPNPYSPVVIDPAYLNEVEDVGVLVDGVKKAMRLVEGTVMFQQIGATFTNRTVPGCEPYRLKSEEYWTCFIRVMAHSMGDVVGTAAMGRVVDNELKVLGTERLRVIDASVMPTIVSGGTSPATLAIAEKGADMILRYWGPSNKATSLTKESFSVASILKESASKLRTISGLGSSIFFQHIKNSPSYRDMAIKSGVKPVKNPFHLIGPLVTASLMNVGPQDHELTKSPELEVLSTPTHQPYVVTPPTTHSLTPPTTHTLTPPTTPLPLMATLFSDPTPYQGEVTSLPESHPYLLQPKTTPHPYHGTFVSSVDSFLQPYLTQENKGARFSQTLPILGFAKVAKDVIPTREKDLASLLSSSGGGVQYGRARPNRDSITPQLIAMTTGGIHMATNGVPVSMPVPLQILDYSKLFSPSQPSALLLQQLLNNSTDGNSNDLASSVDSLLLKGPLKVEQEQVRYHTQQDIPHDMLRFIRLPVEYGKFSHVEQVEATTPKSVPFSKVLQKHGDDTVSHKNHIVYSNENPTPVMIMPMGGGYANPLLLQYPPHPMTSFRFRILNQEKN